MDTRNIEDCMIMTIKKDYRKWKILTGYAIGLRRKHGLPYKYLFKYAR
jgi:hypothetical protein